jgi:hypothetical protein
MAIDLPAAASCRRGPKDPSGARGRVARGCLEQHGVAEGRAGSQRQPTGGPIQWDGVGDIEQLARDRGVAARDTGLAARDTRVPARDRDDLPRWFTH